MSSEDTAPDKIRSWGVCGLIALVAAAGLIGVGVVSWKRRPESKYSPAAEVSVDEYLAVKEAKQIREAWLEKNELYAEVNSDFVRDGKHYPYLHLMVPPAYSLDPRGMKILRSGLDPSRFTELRKYL